MRRSVARRGTAASTFDHVSREAGVSRGLLYYYFGTKEQLLSAILNGVRDRLRAMYARLQARPNETRLESLWAWTSSSRRAAFFRSFFEAYGLALRQPDRFAPFLEHVVADWLVLADREQATLELAVVRGLLLDLLTTGERDRVDAAFKRFLERCR